MLGIPDPTVATAFGQLRQRHAARESVRLGLTPADSREIQQRQLRHNQSLPRRQQPTATVTT